MGARKWIAIALMAIGILTASVGIIGFVFSGGGQPEAVVVPTPSPSPSPSPATATEAIARDFYAQLGAAFQSNNQGLLFDRLHPEVIKLYGDPQCRAHIARIIGNRSFEVVRVHPTAPWNYGEKEGRQIVITDAIQVDVIQRLDNQGQESATHLTISGSDVRWFTDCGDPIA